MVDPLAINKLLFVALFTRAWIEILKKEKETRTRSVALFTRAWIEIHDIICVANEKSVALFTRAWIEIILWLL